MLQPPRLALTWYLILASVPASGSLLAAEPKPGGPAAKTPSVLKISVAIPSEAKLSEKEFFVVWSELCQRKAPVKAALFEITERGFQYDPKAAAVLIGTKLRVANADKIQHNSFALKNVSFDSLVQKPGTFYDVKLEKPGLTKVFCRIHPKMLSEILVLNNPCFEVRTAGALQSPVSLPGASGKVWIWSPRLKSFHSSESKNESAAFHLTAADFTASAPEAESESTY